MKVVPLFKGLGSDSPVVPSATVVNANAWPLPSAVQFGIPTPIQRMRSPNEFASISAQERRILTIDDSDLFSVMYMSNPKPQTVESILTTPAPMLLASSPPASPNTLTFTGSSPSGPAELLFTGSSPPGLAAPEFTGSSPPATPSLPPVQHKDTTELPRPVLPVSSLIIPEQKIQAQVPAFEPIYPQNTPIIPFISDGTRQPTPTDEDESKKGAVNASGIASILQEMLHVPLEKITIDGKPVVLDDLGQVGNGGNVNVMVMNPDNQKTGPGQNVGAKGAPNDDDVLDDDGPDAEPTTHSLDVDRFKHRNHALGHAHVHAHARLQKSRLSSDDDTKPKPSSNNDSDGSASDDSDSDDDSDSEIEIETETDSDDDYKIVRYTTPTKSSSSEDSTSVETPTPTRTRKKISPTTTDSSSTSSKD
ncbi:hypothetical protein IW148_000278 [Coemansia sp. RSA 1199]|nr:hypothetical protein IW148_000278 [Coemansia sp. RSA 1199]